MKAVIAARVAEELRRLPDILVNLRPGGFGELRVAVEGEDAYDGSRLWYPRPSKVVAAVRRHLGLQVVG